VICLVVTVCLTFAILNIYIQGGVGQGHDAAWNAAALQSRFYRLVNTSGNHQGWILSHSTYVSANYVARLLFGAAYRITLTILRALRFSASEISSQVYVIRKNFPDGEYLYIENKQPMLWDSNFEGNGLAIYKVDDNADMQKNRGYPGHPNWPNEHYRVHVLQADGKTDIEQGISLGDAGDFWTKGMTLASGGDWPNTNSMTNGLQPTGITINVITDSSFVMVFQVTGLN